MDKPLLLPDYEHRARRSGPAGWGTPMPLLHDSIADITEGQFITRVLADVHHRESIFNIKGLELDGATVREGVQLHKFRKGLSGDIDILVLPAGHPERATAIQVKRFKVGTKAVRTGRPNGLGEFKKGIKQANRNADLGFFQVYLWVFVLVDTREQNAGRFTYDGVDSLLRSRIHQAISPAGLHPRVGLMNFEWVQPMDRAPLEFGTYGGHLQRLANPADQPADLTEWLLSLA
jgi:hypothetical protein